MFQSENKFFHGHITIFLFGCRAPSRCSRVENKNFEQSMVRLKSPHVILPDRLLNILQRIDFNFPNNVI